MKDLFDKMKRVIDSSKLTQKLIVARYLSLANRRLHVEVEKSKRPMVIAGASQGLKRRYEDKFGKFLYESEFIRV